jgi:hypothetical protein
VHDVFLNLKHLADNYDREVCGKLAFSGSLSSETFLKTSSNDRVNPFLLPPVFFPLRQRVLTVRNIETHIETNIETNIETHVETIIETHVKTHIETHIETNI